MQFLHAIFGEHGTVTLGDDVEMTITVNLPDDDGTLGKKDFTSIDVVGKPVDQRANLFVLTRIEHRHHHLFHRQNSFPRGQLDTSR